MKYEEALKRIDYCRLNCDKEIKCEGNCNACDNALVRAIEALDKQIPLRAINKAVIRFGTPNRVCPLCGTHFYEGSNYCEHCGQRLV